MKYESPDLAALPRRPLTMWNRTWLKRDANSLASASMDSETVPMVAVWNVGAGKVAAAAFAPRGEELEAISNLVARPPRDREFNVSWTTGPQFIVSVDARDN